MSWQTSLVKLSNYEVEQLRKRLAAIVDRASAAQVKLALLYAEAETEQVLQTASAEAGWYRLGYFEGWRMRRDATMAEIAAIAAEEAGARDALADAFAELKKYEQIAENAVQAAATELARKDAAVLDELGTRMAARR